MESFSTRQVAKMLGITEATLSRYISAGKIPRPKTVHLGDFQVHAWTEAEVEHVRQLLPKIANGRKTRWKKKQTAVSKQQSAKRRKPKKK